MDETDQYVELKTDEIIEEIRAHLSGDRGADVSYLAQQNDIYKDHPGAGRLIEEIGRLMGSLMPDKRAEFAALHREQKQRWDLMFTAATTALKRGDTALAEEILGNLISYAEKPPDSDTVFYDFQDQMERLWVLARAEEKRNVRDAPFPIMGVHQMLCAIQMQENRPRDALRSADCAVAANLVAVMPRVERTYCLQKLGRWQELLDSLMEAFPLCWKPIHFAQWYRALAPWYFNAQDAEGFGVCLLLSLACAEHEEPRQLLRVAGQLFQIDFENEAFSSRVAELAKAREIPLRPEPLWNQLAMNVAKQYLERENWEEGHRYLCIAYDLCRDPALKTQIEWLQTHLEAHRQTAAANGPTPAGGDLSELEPYQE